MASKVILLFIARGLNVQPSLKTFFKNLGHNQPVADADVGAAPEGLLRAAADPRLRGVGARLRPEVDILQTLKIN